MTERERFEAWWVTREPTTTNPHLAEIYATVKTIAWQGWEAKAAATAPRPAPEGTVLVRIPVVVDKDGAWAATALCIDSDEDAIESANEWLDGASATAQHERRLSWVTAHVPLPAAPTEVEGTVE